MIGLRPSARSGPSVPVAFGSAPGSRLGAAAVALFAVAAAATTALDGPSASAGWILGSVFLGAVAARGPVAALAVLLVVSALQNLVAAPVAGFLSASAVVALLLGKEAFAAGAGLAGFLRGRADRWLPGDVGCAAYLAIVAVVAVRDVVVGTGIDQGWLVALRQATTLPFLWLVGRGLALRSREEEGAALGWILRVGVVVAVFGLVERFVLGDQLWISIGLRDLYQKKGLGTFYWDADLPANFWSFYGGVPIRRLAGTLGEPTSTAHFLAIPAALLASACFEGRRPGRAATLLALGIGTALLLTLGKSGVAAAALGVGAVIWKVHPGARKMLLAAGLATLPLFVAAVRFTPDLHENLVRHLRGLPGLVHLSPLGDGFGTAGNLALTVAGADPSEHAVVESFIAVLDAEAGLVAVAGFVGFVVATTATLLSARGPGARVRAVLGGLVLATGLAAIGSETPVGFIGGGTAFLIAGAFAHPPGLAHPESST